MMQGRGSIVDEWNIVEVPPPPGLKEVRVDPKVTALRIIWLASDLSDGKTGGRYVGKNWDPPLPPDEAAEKAREVPVFLPPPPGTR